MGQFLIGDVSRPYHLEKPYALRVLATRERPQMLRWSKPLFPLMESLSRRQRRRNEGGHSSERRRVYMPPQPIGRQPQLRLKPQIGPAGGLPPCFRVPGPSMPAHDSPPFSAFMPNRTTTNQRIPRNRPSYQPGICREHKRKVIAPGTRAVISSGTAPGVVRTLDWNLDKAARIDFLPWTPTQGRLGLSSWILGPITASLQWVRFGFRDRPSAVGPPSGVRQGRLPALLAPHGVDKPAVGLEVPPTADS